jgi:hypothetical protein
MADPTNVIAAAIHQLPSWLVALASPFRNEDSKGITCQGAAASGSQRPADALMSNVPEDVRRADGGFDAHGA